MPKNTTRARFVVPCVLLAGLAAGCSTTTEGITHAGDIDSVRANPSPAMVTLADRNEDRGNVIAKMKDTNLRLMREDGARALQVNRPSRLTPVPTPY